MREGAVYMRLHDLARRADVRFVELVVASDAEQREADTDLVFEDLEEAHHAGRTGGGEPVDIEPTAGDRVGAEDQRLDHIGAATDAFARRFKPLPASEALAERSAIIDPPTQMVLGRRIGQRGEPRSFERPNRRTPSR